MDDDRRAVVVGTIVTAVTTAVLFVLPAVVPLETINAVSWHLARDLGLGGTYFSDHPLTNLRLVGGVPGGLVAGYLSRDDLDVGRPAWSESARNGILAVLGGLVGLYVVYVLYQLFQASLGGTFPPPFYLIAVIPVLILLPFFPMFLLEGIVAAMIGHAAYQRR